MLTRMIDQALVAFVPNRWIAENIILAQEVVHSLKKKGQKKRVSKSQIRFPKDLWLNGMEVYDLSAQSLWIQW